MDLDVFDDVARQAAEGSSRRSLVRAGLGALGLTGLGLVALSADADAGGKGKGKKKGKKKKRCKAERPITCGSGCCPSQYPQCCESASDPNQATRFDCNPSTYTCCSVSLGGGSCPPNTKCCGPTAAEDNEFGTCAPTAATCCPASSKGDWCPAGETCVDSSGNCPAGTTESGFGCCEPDGGSGRTGTRSGGAERFRMKAR